MARQLKRGFTLIEMLVVLAITGLLLTATAVRGEATYQRLQMETTLQTILQAYESVRHHAIAEGDDYRVIIDKKWVGFDRLTESGPVAVETIDLPGSIHFYQGSEPLQIIAGSGHLSPDVSVALEDDQQIIRISFQLGGEYAIHRSAQTT